MEAIPKLDAINNINMDTEQTYEGGCKFLLDWINRKLTF